MPATTESLLGPTTGQLNLEITGEDHVTKTYAVTETKCSIGSDENCGIRLQGEGIRPVHCVILRSYDRTIVRRWAGNTWLNGRPFDDTTLRAGDELRLANVRIRVVSDNRTAEPRGGSRLRNALSSQWSSHSTSVEEQSRPQEVFRADTSGNSTCSIGDSNEPVVGSVDAGHDSYLASRITALESMLKDVVQSNAKTPLDPQRATLQQEKDELEQELEKATVRIRELEATAAEQVRDIELLKGQVTSHEDDASTVSPIDEDREAIWQAKFDELEAEREAEEAVNRQYQDDLRKKVKELTDTILENEEEVRALKEQVSSYQKEARDAHEQLEEKTRELETLVETASEMDTERVAELESRLEEDAQVWASQKSELDEKVAQLEGQLATNTEDWEKQKTQLESQVAAFEQNATAVAEQESSLATEHSELVAKCEMLTEERDTLVAELAKEREELTKEREGLVHERDELSSERSDLVSERDELQKRLAELTKERDEIADERGGLTKERDELTNERDQLATERDELTKARDELSEQLATLQSSQEDSRISQLSEMNERQQELDQARDELQQLKDQLKVERQELEAEREQVLLGPDSANSQSVEHVDDPLEYASQVASESDLVEILPEDSSLSAEHEYHDATEDQRGDEDVEAADSNQETAASDGSRFSNSLGDSVGLEEAGDDEMIDDGVIDDGVIDDGVIDDGVIDDGVIDDGVIDDGVIDDGVIDDGVIDDGVIDEEEGTFDVENEIADEDVAYGKDAESDGVTIEAVEGLTDQHEQALLEEDGQDDLQVNIDDAESSELSLEHPAPVSTDDDLDESSRGWHSDDEPLVDEPRSDDDDSEDHVTLDDNLSEGDLGPEDSLEDSDGEDAEANVFRNDEGTCDFLSKLGEGEDSELTPQGEDALNWSALFDEESDEPASELSAELEGQDIETDPTQEPREGSGTVDFLKKLNEDSDLSPSEDECENEVAFEEEQPWLEGSPFDDINDQEQNLSDDAVEPKSESNTHDFLSRIGETPDFGLSDRSEDSDFLFEDEESTEQSEVEVRQENTHDFLSKLGEKPDFGLTDNSSGDLEFDLEPSDVFHDQSDADESDATESDATESWRDSGVFDEEPKNENRSNTHDFLSKLGEKPDFGLGGAVDGDDLEESKAFPVDDFELQDSPTDDGMDAFLSKLSEQATTDSDASATADPDCELDEWGFPIEKKTADLDEESQTDYESDSDDFGLFEEQNDASEAQTSEEDYSQIDEGDGGEVSIEDYMNSLLARVGGGASAPTSEPDLPQSQPPEPDIPQPVLESIPAESELPMPSTPVLAEEPKEVAMLSASEFVPRSRAPEANLAAMRELANASTRSAIDRADKSRTGVMLMTNVGASLIPILVGLSLVVFGLRGYYSLLFFGVICCFVGAYMFHKSYNALCDSRALEASKGKKAARQPA